METHSLYVYLYRTRRINRHISRLPDAKFRNLKEQAKPVLGDFNVLYRQINCDTCINAHSFACPTINRRRIVTLTNHRQVTRIAHYYSRINVIRCVVDIAPLRVLMITYIRNARGERAKTKNDCACTHKRVSTNKYLSRSVIQ